MKFVTRLAASLAAICTLSHMPLMAKELSAQHAHQSPASANKHANLHDVRHREDRRNARKENIQVGPRPYFLVADMDPSPLKDKLMSCADGPFKRTEFTVSHRGAPLMFPEHTKESYEAAFRMGAGIQECDVTFTHDRELVCRHSQCDLHTTTNILATDLAAKCSQPFVPADPLAGTPAQARCCTSDITLAEFKSLRGKMDAANLMATTVEDYMKGTADWRTDLYASKGTLLTHKESIALFRKQGVKMTPELKEPSVPMPYLGFYTQEQYAQQMINEYKEAGIQAQDVFPQSFRLDDVLYWIENEPHFGRQAVFLDGRYDDPTFNYADPSSWNPSMEQLAAQGVEIIAPPLWMLVRVDESKKIQASTYAERAKAAGLDIITWSFERDGLLANGGGFYFQSINGLNQNDPHQSVINNDGDMMDVLDVIAREVGVKGVFTDWPGTVTYYANCMGLR